MLQEKGITNRKPPNNVSKTVRIPIQSKFKPATTPGPKSTALCAKVNSTWNSVLNKNKVIHSRKQDQIVLIYENLLKDLTPNRTSLPHTTKYENDFQIYDPLRTMHFLITELKTNIEVLLPGIFECTETVLQASTKTIYF